MKRTMMLLAAIFITGALFISGCGGGDETTTGLPDDYAAQNGDTVSVHYTGTLEDGTEFDSSAGKTPLSFEVGAGRMISGFDAAVVGMKVGDTKTITLPPEEAYGQPREDLIVRVERENWQQGVTYTVGQQVQLGNNPGVVTEVTAGYIMVDINHRLAGKTLTFEIEMVSITPAPPATTTSATG